MVDTPEDDESWSDFARRIHESTTTSDTDKILTLMRVLIEIGDEATYNLWQINESLQLRTTAKHH